MPRFQLLLINRFVQIVLLCFLAIGLMAQRAQIDSLLKRLSIENTDSGKAKIYRSIGESYIDNNNGLAIAYFRKSVDILKQESKPLQLANDYYSMGYCYLQKSDFTNSLNNYLLSMAIYEKLKDSVRLANAYMSISNVYEYNSDVNKVIQYNDKAEQLIRGMKNNKLLSDLFGQKGNFYGHRQQYDSALFYYQKEYNVERNGKDIYAIVACLSNIGLTYKHQNNIAKALLYFDSIMILNKKEKLPPDMMSMVYNNIAATHAQAKEYTIAKQNFDSSIRLATDAGFPDVIRENYLNLADMYGDEKDYQQQAFYLKKYYNLKDSLYSLDAKNQLTELEADYQIGQKNAELSQKQNEVERKTNQRNLFLIMAVAAAVLLFTSIVFYSRIRHKNKMLTEKNVQINQQKNELQNTLQELKSTQAQLIQSEKMASLGELTAGIAHEIQNPLNFVNNFSELNKEIIDEMQTELKAGNVDEAILISNDIRENEAKINHHGKRADAIVKGMLQHSRKNTGQKEMTDINALCDEYLRLSYHGLRAKDKAFNADYITEFDDSIGKINIVAQDMGRVLLNLFNNAFYAVKEKKKTAGEVYKPLVSVTTKKIDNKIEIKVTDNGSGISQSIIDKVFQPFFTTKPTGQGTGLGLSLSYDIITKEHGGTIQVESEESKGTTFIITLPL